MFSEFERYLLQVAPPSSGLRPFICEGSPLECDVALVGYNPATALEADFWEFWVPGQGFDKARWFETYKSERRSKPLKPGKSRRTPVSPTRKRIELFLDGLGDRKCIETNLYWDASPDISSHQPATQSHLVELLQQIPALRLVVCHHGNAFQMLSARIPSVEIRQVDHFASRKRGWTDRAAFELGQRMRSLCDALSG
ncbi:hypothetical protein [Jiella sp. M17.18]|uniref:hypothetical protein n=1 Tax=Jiella sp. M17.18 TaxID=3234247 RepID=UPI0034DF8081